MQTISTPHAPSPAGHYAQAVEHQGLIYVSGQLPVKPGQTVHEAGPLEEQARQVLSNLDAVLTAADSDREHVLKVTVYISDIALWARVNAVYAQFFGEHRPARAVVPTRELHYGYQIEIEAIAAVRESR